MRNWVVDYTHSIVGFEVTHMMVSKVRGHFESFTALIEADDLMDLTTAKIAFTFDADSVNTRNKTRDYHLKSADFFDIKNNPTIDFKTTHIIKNRDGYKVNGNLTIKGTTKQVVFDVGFGGKAIDPNGAEVYGFHAETTINREEFGLTWNAALEAGGVLVGQEVDIIVELELKDPIASNKMSVEKPPLRNESKLEPELNREDIHQLIADHITDFILLMNQNGVVEYVSPSLKAVLNDVDSFIESVHPNEQDTVRNDLISCSSRMLKKALKSEFKLLHREGYYLDVEADIIRITDPSIAKYENELILVVMRDISERKEVEKNIYQLAFHDHLTNLPNRRSFMNQLRSEVMDRKYSRSKLSVLFVDLDNFKQINDQWGHDAGDMVLKNAAQKIQTVIRPTDFVARFGGDEFIVMLKDVQDEEDVVKIVQRILMEFQNPIHDADREYSLSCSIGAALYPKHGETPEELIQNADTALYFVKEDRKSDFMVFNRQIEHQSLERRILESALRQGIKEQQFYLEYQPKLNITSNEIIGMEALVRWNHPDFGVISPGKFIPLAEETGLIVPLGEWILRESCRQASEWLEKDYPSLTLSVNISVRQLEDLHFVDKLKAILQETELDPNRLEIEITESVLANTKSTIAILKEIRGLGVQISVDDFGTGYSSLSYIKELPIDTLKIDQSFVKDIHENKESIEIAKTIINLAHSIGLNVIAEGIELEEHVHELSKEGCTFGQGYYYSRPLEVGAFEKYMETNQGESYSMN